MRTLIVIAAFSGLCLAANAQKSVGDSVRYYEGHYSSYQARMLDSARQSDSGRYFSARLQQLKDRSRSYTAFMIFGEAGAADFSTLNTAIALNGFGPFAGGPVWRVGLGVSHKAYNGIMIDFNYGILGIDRVDKANGSKITADFANVLGLQLGYAVVNGNRFTLYPYGGLSLRISTLRYNTPVSVNPNYRSIASLIENDQSTTGNAYHLGYEAGIGIEYAIAYDKKTHGGAMLFGKFGTDGSFGDETYHIAGVDYHSGIKYGAWIAELGFKFFGRNTPSTTPPEAQ